MTGTVWSVPTHATPGQALVLRIFPGRTFLRVHQGKGVISQEDGRKHVCVTVFGDVLLATSAPTHTCPSMAVRGSARAVGVSAAGSQPAARSCWPGCCVRVSELSAQLCGLTGWSHVSFGRRVGVGQTKGLLRGPEFGGLPASKGLLFQQRKMHDFVPEEMSHLHSRAGGVWKHGEEY